MADMKHLLILGLSTSLASASSGDWVNLIGQIVAVIVAFIVGSQAKRKD